MRNFSEDLGKVRTLSELNKFKEELRQERQRTAKGDFVEIDKSIEKIKTVNVRLAFEPEDRFIDEVHKMLSENLDEKFVINLIYDPSIVGGVQIEYKGKFFDGSLKTKIIDIWPSIKDELI